jgi:hypothetical protein
MPQGNRSTAVELLAAVRVLELDESITEVAQNALVLLTDSREVPDSNAPTGGVDSKS